MAGTAVELNMRAAIERAKVDAVSLTLIDNPTSPVKHTLNWICHYTTVSQTCLIRFFLMMFFISMSLSGSHVPKLCLVLLIICLLS